MIARSVRGRCLALCVLSAWMLAACHRPLPFPTPGQELVVLTTAGPLTYTPSASSDSDAKTHFQVTGLEHDLANAFAEYLEAEVRFVVVRPESLPDALKQHKAHLAAVWSSIAEDDGIESGPKIAESFDVLVQNQDNLPVRSVDQLADKAVSVVQGSRQHDAILALQGKIPGLKIKPVNGLDPLKLLEQVASRQVDLAVLDSATVTIGLNYYPNLDTALKIGEPYAIRWLFPADGNPELRERANSFIEAARRNGVLKRITDRYLGHLARLGQIDNAALLNKMRTVLPGLRQHFMDAEQETGLDWRLLAALAYQESAWDPLATSYTNVRGIMMLTEDTADRLGVTNRLDSRQSIMAGARYLALLKQQLPESVAEPDRSWIAMAAYNVGPGSISAARSFAQKNGLNPSNWFDMKKALPMFAQVSQVRGGEAVIMVENVRLMYSTLQRFEPAYVPQTSIFDVVSGHKKKKPSPPPAVKSARKK